MRPVARKAIQLRNPRQSKLPSALKQLEQGAQFHIEDCGASGLQFRRGNGSRRPVPMRISSAAGGAEGGKLSTGPLIHRPLVYESQWTLRGTPSQLQQHLLLFPSKLERPHRRLPALLDAQVPYDHLWDSCAALERR